MAALVRRNNEPMRQDQYSQFRVSLLRGLKPNHLNIQL